MTHPGNVVSERPLPVALGPFVLQERLGKGGMAEVWRAVHEGDGVAVAVKVLTEERARRPRSRLQFRQEVRAMARLDHPHVVRIHDAGAVSAGAAGASEGSLVAGMPYLVMDLLPGGSLWRYRGRLRWADLSNLLRVLLDALAHAHARGVIHRDLKPANVLVSAERRAVISDFGLARLPGQTVMLRAGTPSYMAPEQFLDQWRDFGPWTDLYGFGCLVWTLITGTPPFRRSSWDQTRDAHLREALPPLEALQPVPAGVEEWLQRFLVKDPAGRMQCAADAAWGLEQIEPGDDGSMSPLTGAQGESTTEAMPAAESSTVSFGTAPAFASMTAWSVGRNDAPPPPPEDWRGPVMAPRPHMRGAGLGVLGARALPTVGREAERDLLWRELVQVHGLPLARAVILEGAAGTGKTHLAHWLSERAQEVGAATALAVDHETVGGKDSGLRGMLRVHFGIEGLDRQHASLRVAEVARSFGTVDPRDQRVLMEIALDEASDDGSRTPERMAVLSRHLCAVGARRPVVLVVDQAHRGIDALVFVRWLLERRDTEPTPVVILIVVQDEGLGQSTPARELLTQIAGCTGVSRIRVEPLPLADQRALIRGLVGLEGELASRVCDRTRGNPAFAVSLVEDWVTRGLLRRTATGYRLRQGTSVHLPDGLHAQWANHLEQALADLGEPVWRALELAAVIGIRVETEEWRRLAHAAGTDPSLEAVERLVARRLAVVEGSLKHWRFVQGMVRESLVRRAEEGGRAMGLHEVVLTELTQQLSVGDRRMARHLLGAGRASEGIACLVQAASGVASQGHPHGVLDLCDQAEGVLPALPPGGAELWWAPIRLLRAQALAVLGRFDEAKEAAESVAALCRPGDAALVEATTVLATLHLRRGELAGARSQIEAILPQIQLGVGRPEGPPALVVHATVLHELREYDAALEVGKSARGGAAATHNWPTWAEATAQVARTLMALGRMVDAGRIADEGLAQRDRIGHPGGVAQMVHIRADIDRRLQPGDLELVRVRFEEAVDLLDRMGSLDAVLPRVDLATLHVLAGHYGEAQRLGERCRREAMVQHRMPVELSVRAILLLAALGLRDTNAADLHAGRLEALLYRSTPSSVDTWDLIGRAITALNTSGDAQRAQDLTRAVRERQGAPPGDDPAAVPW